MNKEETLQYLEESNIPFEIMEHPAAMTIEDIDGFDLPHAQYIVKNLFLRDDKKRNHYLVVMEKTKTCNLKEIRAKLGTRPLSFASEEDLQTYLGLRKGSVTPLGILNDETLQVQVVIDEDITKNHLVGIHPNDNTATVWINPNDLQKIIQSHGNKLTIIAVQ